MENILHETYYDENFFSRYYGLCNIITHDCPNRLSLFKHPVYQVVASNIPL
jgi:hypothetical protein